MPRARCPSQRGEVPDGGDRSLHSPAPVSGRVFDFYLCLYERSPEGV